MAAFKKTETVLILPWDIIDAGPGIAIDIGGSVIKVLYVHKDDYVEPSKRKQGSEGQLHLLNLSRECIDDAFLHVRKHAYIKRKHPDETIKIYTTGIGGTQFGKRIDSELNVKSENIAESDCFIQSFNYLLRNFSRLEILQELDRPVFEEMKTKNAEMLKFFEKLKAVNDALGNIEMTEKPDFSYPQESYMTEDKPLHEQEDFYPCLLVALGSGMGGMLIRKDGTCHGMLMMPTGGRMFLGLGSLLTGAKTFDELIELCENGVAKNVATTNIQLLEGWDTKEGNNMYSTIAEMNEMIVFFFGHTVGKSIEDFRREDLARCLLEYIVKDLVQFTHLSCREGELSTAVFAGGFANHPLTRRLITEEWLAVDSQMASVQMEGGKKYKKVAIHFLKHGTHLGALGAYLNSKMHFCDHHGAAANGNAATDSHEQKPEQTSTKI